MKQIYNQPTLSHGKTIIDEYIDSLIQNTAEGTQCWHIETGSKALRYYYDTGQGVRIYIMQESTATETSVFSLRMACGENFVGDMLIASEYTPYDYPNRLRELWTVVQESVSEKEPADFDLISYINGYFFETKRKNMFDDLCRVLVTASEDILEVFREKQIR